MGQDDHDDPPMVLPHPIYGDIQVEVARERLREDRDAALDEAMIELNRLAAARYGGQARGRHLRIVRGPDEST